MSNKGQFILVTGGRRSGKSSHALELAESLGERRLYIATAEALDDEMVERVAKHQNERGDGWDTAEEPIDISPIIKEANGYDIILIDCLTLWLCNIMHKSGPTDEDILKAIDNLSNACISANTTVIAVTNELGSGVIPDNALSRRFTDLAGIMNQRMAHAADKVILTVSGISMTIKGGA